MKTFLFNLFLIITAVFPSFALAENDRYRIAVIIPLSGPVASLGSYVRKGLELAYDNLSAKVRDSIEIVYEDDRFDPKQTITSYQALNAEKAVDAVFVLGSPPANALAPLTEKKKQILVAIGASDPNIVKDRQYAFIHWVIPPVLGKKLVDELIRRDFQRVALVAAEASGSLADKNSVVDELTKLGLSNRIVYDQSFQGGETDYRTTIAAIKAKKADAIIVVLFPGALSAFTKQAKQLGLDSEIFGMETFEDEDEDEVKASEGTLHDKLYVNGADPTDDFVKLYKTKFGTFPGWATSNAFDTLNLITASLGGDGNSSNEKVRKYLASIKDYSGASGAYSASGDNRFLLPAALKRVTATGFVTVLDSKDRG